jgi:hypothetical protein
MFYMRGNAGRRHPGQPPASGAAPVVAPWNEWPGPMELQFYRWGFAPLLWIFTASRWQLAIVRFRIRNRDGIAYCCELRNFDGSSHLVNVQWGSDAVRLAVPPGPYLGLRLYPAVPAASPWKDVTHNRPGAPHDL